MNKPVLQMAQLAAVASRFPEIRKALLFGKADAPVNVSRIERIYPGYFFLNVASAREGPKVDGDCIRSASATNLLSVCGKRNSSFVRATGYGRLDFVLALVLPPNPDFNIQEPQLHILAHLTEAKDASGDATTEHVSYMKLGRSFILDVTAIENVVGRVETRGETPSG
ncbi:hypothetical protein FRC08_011278, partial [Ceratobasidium sp. 394]